MSEEVPWGRVLVEALSAILAVRKPVLIRVGQQDYGALLRFANGHHDLIQPPVADLLKFMSIPLEVDPTVEPGFAIFKTEAGTFSKVEFQVLWDALHEIPQGRFKRVLDRDIV